MVAPAWVTLRVGLVSATVATVLGTLAALALVRYGRFVDYDAKRNGFKQSGFARLFQAL